jgi:hypothetical protein
VSADRIPSIGPGIATIYPRKAWTKLRGVSEADMYGIWKIVGGNVDMHMSNMPLWKVLCLVYLEGLAHGSQAAEMAPTENKPPAPLSVP